MEVRLDRVLSGMQASGRLHLGNLIGALQNWVKLQEKYDCFYFIADWHGLTTGYENPSAIKESTNDLLINFLAAGLDPDKCTIFLQSKILQHAELHLLLSMITPLGWLERVPTYKEKQQELKDRDLSTYGFLGYPLLQTADIIIYKAKYVPVGVDQVPHLEISREIARRFNYLYKVVSRNRRLCSQSFQKFRALTEERCQRVMTTQYICRTRLKRLNRNSGQ